MERKELMAMTKEQLVDYIEELRASKGGRKGEVLRLIKETKGNCSIGFIAEQLGIERKNVSSVLSGLRKDGFVFVSFRVGEENLIEFIGEVKEVDGKKGIYNDEGIEVNSIGKPLV